MGSLNAKGWNTMKDVSSIGSSNPVMRQPDAVRGAQFLEDRDAIAAYSI